MMKRGSSFNSVVVTTRHIQEAEHNVKRSQKYGVRFVQKIEKMKWKTQQSKFGGVLGSLP